MRELLQLTRAEEREFLVMERAMRDATAWTDDPALLDLAHPVRVAATPATNANITLMTLAEPGHQAQVKRMLAEGISTLGLFGWLDGQGDKRLDVFSALHAGGSAVHGGFGSGSAGPTIHNLRFQLAGAPVYSFTDELVQLLHRTRLGTDIPVSELALPAPTLYIELGRDRARAPFTLHNAESGEHAFEGAYLSLVTDQAGLRSLEVTMTGSPVGRLELMDDAIEWVSMPVDGQVSIHDALLDAYMKPAPGTERSSYFDDQALLRKQAESAMPRLELIVKCILFLNLSDARQQRVLEVAEAKRVLARAQSGSHRRKAGRALARCYDRIIVDTPPVAGEAGIERTVETHYREGHLRHQRHGPNLSLTKVIWIRPVWVNASNPVVR